VTSTPKTTARSSATTARTATPRCRFCTASPNPGLPALAFSTRFSPSQATGLRSAELRPHSERFYGSQQSCCRVLPAKAGDVFGSGCHKRVPRRLVIQRRNRRGELGRIIRENIQSPVAGDLAEDPQITHHRWYAHRQRFCDRQSVAFVARGGHEDCFVR